MDASPGVSVRLIRVFVSSPGDVAAERDVLDEVVHAINRTDGQAHGYRLELFRWEDSVTPQIGPGPQPVVDAQTPTYDIYLGIMSTRFGTPTGEYGSGTEAEFEEACARWQATGAPWIMFYFDDAPPISPKPQDVEQYLKVCKFREQLTGQGIFATYQGVRGSEHGFYEQISEHLRRVILTLTPPRRLTQPVHISDPTRYLQDLLKKSEFIDVRGLFTGTGQAHRFPIDELFITLTTTPVHARESKGAKPRRAKGQLAKSAVSSLAEDRSVPLEEALRHDRLVVIGDPGAGKTTFLRRVAHTLCQWELDRPTDPEAQAFLAERTFPLMIRLAELAKHLTRHCKGPSAPTGDDAPAWLLHYLTAVGQENGWELDGEFFQQQLQDGCTVLLDGLDEAPDRTVRQQLSRLIENLVQRYDNCRFVVTSRPAGYAGEVVLHDFASAHIEPLSPATVHTFLSRWCQLLYPESQQTATAHCQELLDALDDRPEIRRMARNPVMLTALAVVHWNERRLPEQRADLYESIIRSALPCTGSGAPGREKAERTVELLRELALAMQDHPDGMRTQVSQRWAAEQLAHQWVQGEVDQQAIYHAERFLQAEEMDSGIIVARGSDVQFWHRTFQEFLAARAIAARTDKQQQELLWQPARLYQTEWREVVLLLGGVLHQQGPEKVEHLVHTMFEKLGSNANLSDQARCAGLIGGLLHDLSPLNYRLPQPLAAEYQALLGGVMAIFQREGSQHVTLQDRIEAADALGQAGDPRIPSRINPGCKDYWTTIPAGTFWMGADDTDARDNESPVHEVTLDAFSLARYPVTVSQYRQFWENEGYQNRQWWEAGGFGDFSSPEEWDAQLDYHSRPVVGIDWFEAAAFCAWSRCRLPTEAEWERAARGTAARKYPWGKDEPDENRLNFADTGIGHPTPVGMFPRDETPEGVRDLGGNVWEWCADSLRSYTSESVVNPRGPEQAGRRVIRGGCWFSYASLCRAAFRNWAPPELRDDSLGFRVAAVPPGGPS